MTGFSGHIILSALLKIRNFYVYGFPAQGKLPVKVICCAWISICHLSCTGNPEGKDVRLNSGSEEASSVLPPDGYSFPYALEDPDERRDRLWQPDDAGNASR